MPAQQRTAADAVNEVRIVGRVSQRPEERRLPSGDVVWTFRVVVPRPGRGVAVSGAQPRRMVDAMDCAAWTARARRSVATWEVDDVVEVSGSLRRRFFRTGGGAASRFEVVMEGGRVIRRAASA